MNSYFSHDSNAKDDPKCMLLIEQLGLEGYGIYWVLIELLRDQPENKYPIALIGAIARRYNTTAEKVKTVVYNYDLFTIIDNMFFSDSLNARMLIVNSKSKQASLAGKKSAEKRALSSGRSTDVQRESNGRSTIKVNEIELNKIKENNNKDIVINTLGKELPIESDSADIVLEDSELVSIELKCDKEKSSEKREINYQKIVDIFHSLCPSLPKVRDLTSTRKQQIKSRVSEMGTPEKMYEVFKKIEASDFLSGRQGSFKASFDWVFKNNNNWLKAIEGNYDNNKTTNNGYNGSYQQTKKSADGFELCHDSSVFKTSLRLRK